MDMLLGQVAVLPIEHSLMVEVDAMPIGNVSDSHEILGPESGNPPPNPKLTTDTTNLPPSPKLISDTTNPPPSPK